MYVCIFVQIEETPDKIHQDDRNTIKQEVVGLMLKSPEQVQKQVCTDMLLWLFAKDEHADIISQGFGGYHLIFLTRRFFSVHSS